MKPSLSLQPVQHRSRRPAAPLRHALSALLLAAAAPVLAQLAPAPGGTPKAAPAVAPANVPNTAPAAAPDYAPVEIDDFLQRQRPPLPNSRMIVPVKGVRFDARIESPPEERNITYLFTALKMMGVSELPKVNHRLVLATPQGRQFAVYVPVELVETLRGAKLHSAAQFQGLHVYNYANGPAILLTGVTLK